MSFLRFLPLYLFCALALVIQPTRAQAARALDAFTYDSPKEAAQAWRPLQQSPAPQPSAGGGLSFSMPFSQPLDRVMWDRTISLDLSSYSSFALDLSCDQPEALRSLALYFKSGKGWYIWNKPLKKAGRQTLSILKGDFETEGQPAGWNRIEAIRLSPWKGQSLDTRLILHALVARTDSLLLVQGTTSTRDASARNVAKSATQRMSAWLEEMGIAHGVVTDESVEKGALGAASLAILPYNPYPTSGELKALGTFLERGGKLIVFYGAEPRLAEMMGMKLGAYSRTEKPGRWSSFVFTNPRAWIVPERIYQDSPNIFTAFPATQSAEVIAWWEDIEGRRLKDPAWIATDRGLWMTHILMNDDLQNKREMLAGLIARYQPSAWAAIGRRCMEYAGRIDSFRSLAEALGHISARAEAAPDPARVLRLLKDAQTTHRAMQTLYSRGEYPQVLEQSRILRDTLVEAYARIQPPRPGEFRGVWDHDGVGWFPGDWEKSAHLLADHGINAIFPNLIWGGLAHFPTPHLPSSASVRLYGDQLAQCIKAGRRHGIETHVWMVCWRLDNAPADFIEKLKKQGRLQVNASGKTLPWLSPSHPSNVRMMLDIIRDTATRYDIDGMHLDYIRYSDTTVDFSPTAREAFERWLGKKVEPWPAAARPGGKYAREFKRWRAGEITAFVRQARQVLKEARPSAKLSAAVYGSYPDCIDSIGQDWGEWLKKDYVDFACPMNYTTDLNGFIALAAKQIRLTGLRERIFPGLGVTADESQLTADQVIEQILAARRLGLPGWLLFDLSGTLQRETLPALRLGITR